VDSAAVMDSASGCRLRDPDASTEQDTPPSSARHDRLPSNVAHPFRFCRMREFCSFAQSMTLGREMVVKASFMGDPKPVFLHVADFAKNPCPAFAVASSTVPVHDQ
jgi:hypothetical protein